MLTETERRDILAELRAQEEALREAATDWEQAGRGEGWGVAAICEHLEKTERRIFRLLQSPMLRTDDPTPPAVTDAELTQRVAQPVRPAVAPEPVQPVGAWASAEEFWPAYGGLRADLYAWIETTEIPLRVGRCPHPFLGMLDGYQWLLFIAAHGRRHIAQILAGRA
jgi:hypothetical protein